MLISRKLPLAAAILTVVSIAASSAGALFISSNALKQEYQEKLSAIADGRRNQLETYLDGARKDVDEIAVTHDVAAALNLFGIGLSMVEDGKGQDFIGIVRDSSSAEPDKEQVRAAGAGVYLNHHKKYGAIFEKIAQENGFEDIYLINADGKVVYTLLKRDDFSATITEGEWQATPLSKTYSNAVAQVADQGLTFVDYSPYAPGTQPLTAFIGRSVIVGDEVKGAFIVALPTARIAQIMSNRTGLGRTGETVLLRSDGTLLTDSHLSENNDIGSAGVDPSAFSALSTTQEVLNAEAAEYQNMTADAAFARVDFLNSNWVVAALVDHQEAGAAVTSMRNLVLIVALLLLGAALASALLFSRTLTKPILALVTNMRALSEGRTDFDIDNADRKDEIGDMVRSVAIFKEATIEKERLEREAEEHRTASERDAAERAATKADEAQQMQHAVDALADGLTRLSEGDLSVRLDDPFMDSLDRLRVDFNMSVERLNSTLTQIRGTAGSIDGNANEMRAAADDLSRRTEQQAASLEETSAALEEITSTVQEASERAAEAAEMANTAKGDADRSSAVVADAVAAMEGIEKASSEISSIIGVIDEIAFQTNLLALNAGVEAARAGEAGKGFAVVAQEVRELAQRAASAASEIKQLITKSGQEVSSGVGLVRETGQALEEISRHVTEINDRIGTVATAAKEQLSGVQEVNSAVVQMDQMTQQNAAMVEQTNAVTHQLADDVGKLSSMVSDFQLKDTVRPHGFEEEQRLAG